MAEVTSEHRKAAAVAWYHPYGWRHLQLISWIETGVRNAGIAESLERAAKAIADAEARGRAASSAEVTRLEREVERLKTRLHQHEGRYDTEGLLHESAPIVTPTEPGLDPAFQSHTPELLMRFYDHIFNADGTRKATTVASAELEADLKLVREVYYECAHECEFSPGQKHHDALSRIAAAIGVKL